MRTGGIGAELTASINDRLFDELDAPVLRLASQDIPTPYNGFRATDDCAARANCGSSKMVVSCGCREASYRSLSAMTLKRKLL